MTEPTTPEPVTPDDIDARYVDPPSSELAIIGPPGPAEWEAFKEQARWLASSSLVKPALRGKESNVMLIMLASRELQIPPVMGMSTIHIIEGTPTLSAKTQMALVKRAGHYMRVIESTPEQATIRFGRKGEDPADYGTFSYTLEDAKVSGLLGKDNWKKNPKAMLRARCITAVTTMEFPDVLMGVTYSAEEMGADVDPITGEVESIPAEQMVSTDEAAALYARIAELDDDATAAFRARMIDLGLVIGRRDPDTGAVLDVRLPVRYLQTVVDELEVVEAWRDSIPDAELVAEPAAGQDGGGEGPGDSGGSAGERGESVDEPDVTTPPPSPPPAPADPDSEVADAELIEDEPASPLAGESPNGDGDRDTTPDPSAAAPVPTDAVAPAPPDNAADVGTGAPVEPSAKGQRSRFAALCAESDLTADDRHALVAVITSGRTKTSTKTSKHEGDLAIKAAKLIRDGLLRLAWTDEAGNEIPEGADASGAGPTLLALDPQDGTPAEQTPGMIFLRELAEYDGRTVVVA